MNAVDSHAHVFCDKSYAFSPETLYHPHPSQMGTAKQFRAVLDFHGFTHGLLVGAGPYGADNRCMLSAIAESNGRFKGVALVKPEISDKDLAALKDQGVVGIRVNLMGHGLRELTEPGADKLLARIKEMDLFLQVHLEKANLAEAAPILRKAGVRCMFDHFGRPDPSRGLDQPGFRELLEFGRAGDHVVKISGPFRSSLAGYPYTDVDPYVAACIEAYTLDRCVWGSDWPFVRLDARFDYGPPSICIQRWLPNEADRRKVLWDTPARLFGFQPS
ncbi:MAG TPA: amidohydrolase family protein [Burkholderiales bacterium]|nr:amidohydrolase family protein [Burkholderiales bacterium]